MYGCALNITKEKSGIYICMYVYVLYFGILQCLARISTKYEFAMTLKRSAAERRPALIFSNFDINANINNIQHHTIKHAT